MRHWIRGHHYEITRKDIERAARTTYPEHIRIHYVMVEQRPWPVKQLIALVTGRPPNTYNTDDARRILDALGFDLLTR